MKPTEYNPDIFLSFLRPQWKVLIQFRLVKLHSECVKNSNTLNFHFTCYTCYPLYPHSLVYEYIYIYRSITPTTNIIRMKCCKCCVLIQTWSSYTSMHTIESILIKQLTVQRKRLNMCKTNHAKVDPAVVCLSQLFSVCFQPPFVKAIRSSV